MMLTIHVVFIAITVLSATNQVLGRERWLERNNKPVYLHPRRFGQEHPAVLEQLSAACPGEVCGVLAGQAVTPLLAGQPECSQQDQADAIIDASGQFDAATQANMIAIAIEYRQAEKNTPPDFSTNPPSLRNSVFCQKAPRNSELNGLVQAQDPANDPNLFFDPALGSTVTKGSQANTFPFGEAPDNVPASAPAQLTPAPTPVQTEPALLESSDCPTAITVTVTVPNPNATPTNAVTITIGNVATSTSAPEPTVSAAPPAGGIGDFGRCTVPEIEFGTGFDGRKETSFQPVDKESYNHGSAQGANIITQFMCDQLVNFCGADQTAKTTCATASAAAAAAQIGTGAQADAFNAVFGITTDFNSIAAVDDKGSIVPGTGSGSSSSPTSPSSTSSGAAPADTPVNGAADFGSCSVPQIEFGTGFDGRTETSFRPVDRTSFNQGSAQNINIITNAICDRLNDSCKANQAAKDTCSQASAAAAAAAPAGSGAQADAFNAAFGISTNFAAVPQVDSQGNTAGSSPTNTATSPSTPPPSLTQPTPSPPDNNGQGNNGDQGGDSNAQQGNGDQGGNKNGNLQTFTENLGGVSAPVVTSVGNGQFQVEGNSAINGLRDALVRSCDVQNNQCADAANASGNQGDLTVDNCGQQQLRCTAAAEQTAAQQ